eukprot:Partr_v1_DN25804_c1_g1_i6_m2748
MELLDLHFTSLVSAHPQVAVDSAHKLEDSPSSLRLGIIKNPNDIYATLLKDQTNKHDLWSFLWASSFPLAELIFRLYSSPHGLFVEDVENIQCIEIGAGSGLASLAAAKCSIKSVATDFHPLSVELCRINAFKNGVHEKLSTMELNWHRPTINGKYQLVIGADILFMSNSVTAIIKLLDNTMSPDSLAIIVDPGRANFEDFRNALESSGNFNCLQRALPNWKTPICTLKMCVITCIWRTDGWRKYKSGLDDLISKMYIDRFDEFATEFGFCANVNHLFAGNK